MFDSTVVRTHISRQQTYDREELPRFAARFGLFKSLAELFVLFKAEAEHPLAIGTASYPNRVANNDAVLFGITEDAAQQSDCTSCCTVSSSNNRLAP